MANSQTDFWNTSVANPYAITLNDSMTVSSENQLLSIYGFSNESAFSNGTPPIWAVTFVNSTTFEVDVFNMTDGSLLFTGSNFPCINGIVQVTITPAQITFVGTSSTVVGLSFEDLGQIATENNGGSFIGGELDLTLTS
jgi:hypothetical protein